MSDRKADIKIMDDHLLQAGEGGHFCSPADAQRQPTESHLGQPCS